MRIAAARLVVATSLGAILLALVFFLAPPLTFWRSNLFYAMGLALALLFLIRLGLGRALGSEAFKRRVLVLGAGPKAARLEALARQEGASFSIAGHVGMNDGAIAVRHAVNRVDIANLPRHVLSLAASEVVPLEDCSSPQGRARRIRRIVRLTTRLSGASARDSASLP